jgi:putative holliday junction resolvase
MDTSWTATPWTRRSSASEPSLGRRYPETPAFDVRALGIDFGEVRIGLAVSDETGTLATPLDTLRRRRGKRPPWKEMEAAARSHGVTALVFGLPLELSGEESQWTREVRSAAESLGARLDLPVHFVDERMTSVRAEREVRSSGLPLGKRSEKERVDAAAAAIILQSWLDGRRVGP